MSADDSYAPKSPDISSLSLPLEDTRSPQQQQPQSGYYRSIQPQPPGSYQQQPTLQQVYHFPFPHPSSSQQSQQPHIQPSTGSHSSYSRSPSTIGQYPPPQIQPQSPLVQQPSIGYGLPAASSPTYQKESYYPPYGGGPQPGYQVQGYQVPQQPFYSNNKPLGQRNSLQEQPPLQDREIKAEPQPPLYKQESQPSDTTAMPPRKAAASSGAQQSSAAVIPSPVKTKFPTARIKRIMQADEEVGKVAQQTPIAVGKALEMFMIALVSKSAEVAREKNSKRVTAQMLKQVVESDEQWDFLREVVSKVEGEEKKQPSSGGGKPKAKTESGDDTESEEEVVEKKKRAGRKKKL